MQHFVDPNGTTPDFPDTLPADGSHMKKTRLHWKSRNKVEYKPSYQETSTSIHQDGSVSNTDNIMDSTNACQQVLNAEGDSLGLLTAAAQVHELQDKPNSTLETLHQQRVLNHHLQLQLSATFQPSKDPEPDLTVQKILQQEKKVPG